MLPLVGSMISLPLVSRPRFSASQMRLAPIRHFDAEARVAALDLGQHAALGNTVETNQRGVAYGLAVVLKNFAHGAIPVFVKAMKQDYPVVSE